MRLQGPGHRLRAADRRVDIGEEIVARVGGVKVGRLAGIHDRAAADRNVTVEATIGGERRRRLERTVGGLDLDRVIDDRVDAGGLKRFFRGGDGGELGDVGVGEQRHAGHAQRTRVEAELGKGGRVRT